MEEDPESLILEKQTDCRNEPVALLKEEHKNIMYFDENPQAVIQDTVGELMSKFSSLEIKKDKDT